MTTPDDTSEHVMRARANKAGRLAVLLEQQGATPADVRAMPPPIRRLAEALAGVPESSDATWELVAHFVEARATVPADPFDALGAVETQPLGRAPVTVADIRDGDHVIARISSGQVIVDGPVTVVRMWEPDGSPVYARLSDDSHGLLGGRHRGPLTRLDAPATRGDDGRWHVQLSEADEAVG